jgi:Primase C terminal 1 (PriCT-1)
MRCDCQRTPEGRRDCTITKITGYLLRHFIDPIFVAELMQIFNATRCRPPLPPADVERIVNSIAGKELRRRGHG